MSAPITYTDLAELAEAMSLPGAGHLRESADAEVAEEVADLRGADAALDAVWELLDQVPEPPPRGKHDDECWQRHAHCLVHKIREAL